MWYSIERVTVGENDSAKTPFTYLHIYFNTINSDFYKIRLLIHTETMVFNIDSCCRQ